MTQKVLHVIDSMSLGGAQRIVSRLVENNSNHRLHALRRSKEEAGKTNNFTVTDSHWKFNLRSVIDTWLLVHRYDPDVLHCHLKKSKFTGLMVKILSLKDFNLVFHEHGKIWTDEDRYKKILGYTRTLVDKHVAVSEHTSKLLNEEANIPEDKIEVIYNFVDHRKFNQQILTSFKGELDVQLDSEKFVIGFGGRLEERKGWRSIVKLASNLDEGFEVLMTGTGSGEDELREKVKDIENLHYFGYIEDVRSLYSEIDCFVLPSEWDPSPMILYEVQACGIPLVCTDANSINELVEDRVNALNYDYGDISHLTKLVEELSTDEDLLEDISNSGLNNADKYSYGNFIESLETLYKNLNNEKTISAA